MRKFSFLLLVIFISFLFFASFTEALYDPLGGKDFNALITGITTAIAGLVGSLAIIMFIIAGIYLLVSAGDPGRIQTGKDYFKYAIIGTVVALSAGAITAMIRGWFK